MSHTTFADAIEAIKKDINADIRFYISNFCRNAMEASDRSALFNQMVGKRDLLENLTGEDYIMTPDGLRKVD